VGGAELVRNGHFGLVAMRERVEMAGGRGYL
jgi:signal transduction histidine kinase